MLSGRWRREFPKMLAHTGWKKCGGRLPIGGRIATQPPATRQTKGKSRGSPCCQQIVRVAHRRRGARCLGRHAHRSSKESDKAPLSLCWFYVCGVLLLAGMTSPSADAQQCFTASPELAKQIAEARKGRCEVQCSGCGCQGGPGYRARDRARQCVSWDRLNAVCGPPPHARCDRECTPVVEGCDPPKIPKGSSRGIG
jgi:hypothetical protein